MKKDIITRSAGETQQLGNELGKSAGPGTIFALSGELGSGKTVMAKGIARGLGIQDDITSPTFTLLEVYEAPIPLYHFDLYRIEDVHEFDFLGFDEYWEGSGISVIEWADRAGGLIPDNAVWIYIKIQGNESREITIEYPGD